MSAVIAPGPGKAVGKDAAFQIFAKGLADIGLGGVVVALAVNPVWGDATTANERQSLLAALAR